MLQVWGRASSSNVQAVMWTIGELGLPCERFDKGHIHGGLETVEFLEMNPHGHIPVIRDGNAPPIWETGAIIRYLAASYGDEIFWPRDPAKRAKADMWAECVKSSVSGLFTVGVFWAVVRTTDTERDEAALTRSLVELESQFAIAEAQLIEHPYLAGSHFTPANILLGHILFRYYDIDIPRASLPALADFYARISKRPVFQEHVMVSCEMLRITT
jgi:glutathione S-transferase